MNKKPTNTLYIVSSSYTPSTARNNRILAILKGISELNVHVKVFYIFPDKNFHMHKGSLNNVEFIYLWEKCRLKNRYIIFINSIFLLFKYIKKDSNVFVFYEQLISILPLNFLSVKLYHERTEHPEIEKRTHYFIGKMMYKIYLHNCRKLDGLFVITNNLKKYFVSKGVKEDKITVVNMIVDSERFDNVEVNESVEKYIAYCGTVTIGKDGVDDLVKAFHKVSLVLKDIKLYIIGDFISKKDKDIVSQYVKEYVLEERVFFTGKVSFNDMPKILANSQALVLARSANKQATYGFPTKLGEYLVTGNPVIITRTGEIDLFLEDMKSALIAEPDNIDSIADKIIWALSNKEEAAIIGENGKNIALKSFNYKEEANKIISIVFGNKF